MVNLKKKLELWLGLEGKLKYLIEILNKLFVPMALKQGSCWLKTTSIVLTYLNVYLKWKP
jgi:hypothetical protein